MQVMISINTPQFGKTTVLEIDTPFVPTGQDLEIISKIILSYYKGLKKMSDDIVQSKPDIDSLEIPF